jgi:hypothetical protein
MSTFRKKPVEVEAILWTGANVDAVLRFIADGRDDFAHLPNNGEYVMPTVGHMPAAGQLEIPTLEGDMTASPGDWIIRGVQGEFYPCKPDIFEATYEPVAEAAGGADHD